MIRSTPSLILGGNLRSFSDSTLFLLRLTFVLFCVAALTSEIGCQWRPGTKPPLQQLQCYSNLPAPELTVTGSQDYIGSDGNFYTRYRLEVTNSQAFPNDLFLPAPTLPPCGLNPNSSRAWVHIYDNNDNRLYGFCALPSSDWLQSIWFAMPQGTPPPESVSVRIVDRACNNTYASNAVPVAQVAGTCVLPIPDSDHDKITGVQEYKGDPHEGIDFEFKHLNTGGDPDDPTDPNQPRSFDVIAPCGGVITERARTTIPDTTPPIEQISVNIKVDGDLNMFVVFEPDTPNTADVDTQDEQVSAQACDPALPSCDQDFQVCNPAFQACPPIAQGEPLGQLYIRNPQTPDWYPVVHWTVFRGSDTGSLDSGHECPRDHLTPGEQVKLNGLFNQFQKPVCAQ